MFGIWVGQGATIWIDANDFERVCQHSWHARKDRKSGRLYAYAKIGGTAVGLGRFVLGLEKGDEREADHVNLNPLDNRRCNLRIATRFENNQNRRMRSDNTSGYKGVSFLKSCRDGRPWLSQIQANGTIFNLGRFSTAQEGHAAYCEAAERLHGEFKRVV